MPAATPSRTCPYSWQAAVSGTGGTCTSTRGIRRRCATSTSACSNDSASRRKGSAPARARSPGWRRDSRPRGHLKEEVGEGGTSSPTASIRRLNDGTCRLNPEFPPILVPTLALVMTAVGQGPADWFEPFPAHKVVGNVYYVGSRDLATYLITTPEGHVL